MAHGDALIFLTNIVWVFVLFLFIYLFFVVLFLPSFYKKFRIRVLVRGLVKIVSAISMRNILVSLTFFLDFFTTLRVRILSFLKSMLFYFNIRRAIRPQFLGTFTTEVPASTVSAQNKGFFAVSQNNGGVYFVKFKN